MRRAADARALESRLVRQVVIGAVRHAMATAVRCAVVSTVVRSVAPAAPAPEASPSRTGMRAGAETCGFRSRFAGDEFPVLRSWPNSFLLAARLRVGAS